MVPEKEIVQILRKHFDGDDSFIGQWARGNGFDIEKFNAFKMDLKASKDLFKELPDSFLDICRIIIDVPLLLRNALSVNDPAEHIKIDSAIEDFIDIFADNLTVTGKME